MIQKCGEDLERWSKCGLSWLGRVDTVKITLLPQMLYLFLSLLLPDLSPHPKQFICKFQSCIVKFVWGNKGYRCPKEVLLRIKSQGGVGLPNLWWYYQAVQLAQISTVYSRGPKPDWLSMERQAIPLHP